MPGDNRNMTPPLNGDLRNEELYSLTENYPYYSLGQFWLLSRLKKNQGEDFHKQACKTGLFFPQLRWLNKQLHECTKIEGKFDNLLKISNAGSNLTLSLPAERPLDKLTPLRLLTVPNAGDVPFEPLYTVDYFASQGIKLTEEISANDKLATQLKSFTEWLKSMKKVNAQNVQTNDEQTDKIIQHIAESSNINTNVVTEAMAEVLLKQQKFGQAIEMYSKLSLNYPSKSAYFAAKIQSLKTV